MSGRTYNQNPRRQKVMVAPLNLIFRHLQSSARIQIWLAENQNIRIEGNLLGFDEFMNVVLDNGEELFLKTGKRQRIGKIMLKGENIALISSVK